VTEKGSLRNPFLDEVKQRSVFRFFLSLRGFVRSRSNLSTLSLRNPFLDEVKRPCLCLSRPWQSLHIVIAQSFPWRSQAAVPLSFTAVAISHFYSKICETLYAVISWNLIIVGILWTSRSLYN